MIQSFCWVCLASWSNWVSELKFIANFFFFFLFLLDEVLRGWSGWSWQTACASWPLSSSCPPYPARCRPLLSGSSSWISLHWTRGKAASRSEVGKVQLELLHSCICLDNFTLVVSRVCCKKRLLEAGSPSGRDSSNVTVLKIFNALKMNVFG